MGLADGVQALVAVEIVVAVAGAETAAAVVVVDGVAVAFADVVEEVVDIVAEELAKNHTTFITCSKLKFCHLLT